MGARTSGLAVLLLAGVACSGGDDNNGRGAGAGNGAGGFGGAAGAAGFSAGGFGGASGASGASGVGAGGGAAANGNCEELYVDAEPGVPNFLIVLDKSGSMGGQGTPMCVAGQMMVDCNDPANIFQPQCILGAIGGIGGGGVDRWTPSVGALKSITANLQDTMRFGLMTYPGGTDNCGVGDLQVMPAYNTAAAIAGAVDATCPGGATPTAASLRATEAVFDSLVFSPDEKQGVPYVLLVTDGEPNCAGGGGGFQQADEQGSYDAVTALADAGIRTYVIGYDTQSNQQLAGVLDEMARRGNTGDQAHRPVEDEASLMAAFEQIAATAVSCSYKLETIPSDPTFVYVAVDGKQANYNEPDGWTLNGDSIVLQGATCTKIQDGGTHSLDVQIKCKVVVPS